VATILHILLYYIILYYIILYYIITTSRWCDCWNYRIDSDQIFAQRQAQYSSWDAHWRRNLLPTVAMSVGCRCFRSWRRWWWRRWCPLSAGTSRWKPRKTARKWVESKPLYHPHSDICRPTAFIALAFKNGLEYHNYDLRINSGNGSTTSGRNLVSFRSITLTFTRLYCVQQSSTSTLVSLTAIARGRYC